MQYAILFSTNLHTEQWTFSRIKRWTWDSLFRDRNCTKPCKCGVPVPDTSFQGWVGYNPFGRLRSWNILWIWPFLTGRNTQKTGGDINNNGKASYRWENPKAMTDPDKTIIEESDKRLYFHKDLLNLPLWWENFKIFPYLDFLLAKILLTPSCQSLSRSSLIENHSFNFENGTENFP